MSTRRNTCYVLLFFVECYFYKVGDYVTEEGRLRKKNIRLWVTDIEHQVIKDKAKYCGLTTSAYLRKVSVDGIIIKRDYEGLNDINKIGVNINQIAKNANKRGTVIERDVDELRVQYEKLFEIVYGQILNG